jgi:hypothetical protein
MVISAERHRNAESACRAVLSAIVPALAGRRRKALRKRKGRLHSAF